MPEGPTSRLHSASPRCSSACVETTRDMSTDVRNGLVVKMTSPIVPTLCLPATGLTRVRVPRTAASSAVLQHLLRIGPTSVAASTPSVSHSASAGHVVAVGRPGVVTVDVHVLCGLELVNGAPCHPSYIERRGVSFDGSTEVARTGRGMGLSKLLIDANLELARRSPDVFHSIPAVPEDVNRAHSLFHALRYTCRRAKDSLLSNWRSTLIRLSVSVCSLHVRCATSLASSNATIKPIGAFVTRQDAPSAHRQSRRGHTCPGFYS
jgi:hypothetical protein